MTTNFGTGSLNWISITEDLLRAEQRHAVRDDGHHEAADHGVEHAAASTEQARAADDGGGDGQQHGVVAAGLRADRLQLRGQRHAAEGGDGRAHDEAREPHAASR